MTSDLSKEIIVSIEENIPIMGWLRHIEKGVLLLKKRPIKMTQVKK